MVLLPFLGIFLNICHCILITAAAFVRNNKADVSIVQQVLGFTFPALVQTLVLEPEVPVCVYVLCV